MTTDYFCFYLQNRLIQTNQTGGQWYSDTSPFSIPCHLASILVVHASKKFYRNDPLDKNEGNGAFFYTGIYNRGCHQKRYDNLKCPFCNKNLGFKEQKGIF